jgi:hypothetical protein
MSLCVVFSRETLPSGCDLQLRSRSVNTELSRSFQYSPFLCVFVFLTKNIKEKSTCLQHFALLSLPSQQNDKLLFIFPLLFYIFLSPNASKEEGKATKKN